MSELVVWRQLDRNMYNCTQYAAQCTCIRFKLFSQLLMYANNHNIILLLCKSLK